MEYIITGVLSPDKTLTLDAAHAVRGENANILRISIDPAITDRHFFVSYEFASATTRRNTFASPVIEATGVLECAVPSCVLRYAGKVYVQIAVGDGARRWITKLDGRASFVCGEAIEGEAPDDAEDLVASLRGEADRLAAFRDEIRTDVGEKVDRAEFTKEALGLGCVDNTPDAEKNVSSADFAKKDGAGNVIADTYATKTDVANIVGSAPETYDTLKEVADWIQCDETGTAALVGRVGRLEANKLDAEAAARTYVAKSEAGNHTHAAANESRDGFMSKEFVAKIRELDASKVTATNRNLLLNPDFREIGGGVEYINPVDATMEAVKWWTMQYNANVKVTTYVDRIVTNSDLLQYFEDYSVFSERTMTISAKIKPSKSGTDARGRIGFIVWINGKYTPVGNPVYTDGTADEQIVSYTFVVPNTANVTKAAARIYLPVDKSDYTVYWAKLEYGDKATLFVPPDCDDVRQSVVAANKSNGRYVKFAECVFSAARTNRNVRFEFVDDNNANDDFGGCGVEIIADSAEKDLRVRGRLLYGWEDFLRQIYAVSHFTETGTKVNTVELFYKTENRIDGENPNTGESYSTMQANLLNAWGRGKSVDESWKLFPKGAQTAYTESEWSGYTAGKTVERLDDVCERPVATQSCAGLMSAADKQRMDEFVSPSGEFVPQVAREVAAVTFDAERNKTMTYGDTGRVVAMDVTPLGLREGANEPSNQYDYSIFGTYIVTLTNASVPNKLVTDVLHYPAIADPKYKNGRVDGRYCYFGPEGKVIKVHDSVMADWSLVWCDKLKYNSGIY